jgi:hypothetical protein
LPHENIINEIKKYIMVHTVHLNDEFDVKELPKETSRGEVNVRNRYDRNVESGRYMSSEEFRKRAIEKVNKFCDKHGVL